MPTSSGSPIFRVLLSMSTALRLSSMHTVHTAMSIRPTPGSYPISLIWSTAAVSPELRFCHFAYGAEHHEPDSGAPHSPYAAQPDQGFPAALGDPPAQLGENLVPPGVSLPGSTPAPVYASFLHGLPTQIRDDTDLEAGGPLVPDGQSPDGAGPGPGNPLALDEQPPIQSGHVSPTGQVLALAVFMQRAPAT